MPIFPGAISSFAGFNASDTLAADSHASQHNSEQAEIVATQTKIGTGASTSTNNTVLRGNGVGTSTWAQVGLTTDVTGTLPVNNGGIGQTSLSGLTLPSGTFSNPAISGTVSGSAIYTSPTINSPTISSPTFQDTLTGWVNANESWSFSSWDATNVTGVITVPSNATNKYSVGMKGSIQNNGQQYFIITAVAATSLTGYFGTDYILTNNAITSPQYSSQKAPFGFPINPTKWTVATTSSSDRTTTSATLATLTDAITVPIGAWKLSLKAHFDINTSSTSSYNGRITLSSDASTETDTQLSLVLNNLSSATGSKATSYTGQAEKDISLAASATYTLMGKTGAGTLEVLGSTMTPTILKAVCAYL